MKSNVFLFTATLLMMVCIINYHPTRVEIDIEPTEEEVTWECDSALYNGKLFENTCFDCVRARTLSGYAVYEVVKARPSDNWRSEAESLKENIAEYLKSIGYGNELMLMVLDSKNDERVTVIL